MSTRRTLIASAVGLTLLAAGGGFAFAQMKPGHENHGRGSMHHSMEHARGERADFRPGRHIEGRIAFLKAELKITDAQAPAFDKFAEAIRLSTKEAQALYEARKPPAPPAAGQAPAERPRPNALERIERRAEGAQVMAASSQRMLDAFKPLYASLNEDQKKTADELVSRFAGGPGGHGKMHHRHHRG